MRGVRFLVVDDSPMAVKLITGVIRNQLGSDRIFTAADGREAIRVLEKHAVDMIVSDWNMEQMNGDELLYFVRNHKEYKDVPFVMVTSNSQKDFIITALQLGVSQYLIKPFTPAELEKKIRNSWNAANKRSEERYSALPPHRSTLKVDGMPIKATLQDISRGGTQLYLEYHERLSLYRHYELTMAFSDENSGKECCAITVRGEVVRLEADRNHPPHCLAALILNTRDLNETQSRNFEILLTMLAERAPKVISNE